MDVSKLDFQRFRPLRATAAEREKNAEVQLSAEDFILPFFVVSGENIDRPLPSLSGVSHLSVDRLVLAVQAAYVAGIGAVLLFGVPEPHEKNAAATAAYGPDALIPRAIRELKSRVPQVKVITDVCVCAYTDHGHCGMVSGDQVDNDASLPLLAEMALAHAGAGADVVAPSAMMDGQVAAIRARLDESGFASTAILGYSAKYASRLYGPFRDAAGSAPSQGDRKSYQMDPRNRQQGVDEASADLAEGAAWLMVKPATFYLDVVAAVKARHPRVPLAAYHTSGELMMLRHGAAAGLFDWKEALLENLYSIKRAGADLIICYAAVEVADWLK